MGFSLANIENSAKLSIRITFRQKGNWQVCVAILCSHTADSPSFQAIVWMWAIYDVYEFVEAE